MDLTTVCGNWETIIEVGLMVREFRDSKLYIYRKSPVKSPDIKNIIVITLTFLFESSPLR